MLGWQDMDRAALDDAYANAPYIEGSEDFPDRLAAAAAAFRKTCPPREIPYTGDAALDLFLPDGRSDPAGLVVFVHGGYWRAFGRRDWSHLATGALARDHAVAMVGYPLAPKVRISEITRRVRMAVDAAAAQVAGPVRLTGHSAGGHLVARMITADAAPDCADRIATCVPISPVADLRPLLPQRLNDDLRLDEAEAAAESPVLLARLPGPRVSVHVGTAERPSFLWQARALGRAWAVPVREAAGRHHFDVIDALTEPASSLMDDIFA